MYIRSRDESIEQLSETLNPEQLRKAITQQYSALSLSVIADFKKEYADKLIDSRFTAETINKLTRAYHDEKINTEDLFIAVKYSGTDNEPYIDDFLDSIDKGFYHGTAAKTFLAVLYEDCSYKEAVEYVKSGAFYPTEYGSLSLERKVAEQLDQMGVPLRACEGFNYYYDVDDLNEALDSGAAIFVRDKELAVKVCEYMKLPDWKDFKEYIEIKMCGRQSDLSVGKLSELREDYTRKNRDIQLYNKVQGEYDKFIADMKNMPAEIIIESAYEIVSKENIVMYCEEYPINLTDKQFSALLSSKNTLDEVYREWCDNGEWHGLDDIGLALEETADRIQISIDRELAEKKAEPVPEQKQPVKPKNKSR